MKKRLKKLRLNRETVRSLNGNDLEKAAGGFFNCGSLRCTNNCPGTCCGSECICPFTYSVAPANC